MVNSEFIVITSYCFHNWIYSMAANIVPIKNYVCDMQE